MVITKENQKIVIVMDIQIIKQNKEKNKNKQKTLRASIWPSG